MSVPRLVLASASPARLQLLKAAGIPAEVIVSGVDESTVQSDRPDVLSGTLARLKAESVAARLRSHADGRSIVLGCDSVLAFNQEVLGKPRDEGDAGRRWRAMRGRTGVLHTGHCLVDTATGKSVAEVAATTVHFADVSDAEIDRYVATGEPLRVAGAFTLDGLGAPFVAGIEGDPSNVIGLSLPLLRRLLPQLDLEIVDLWRVG